MDTISPLGGELVKAGFLGKGGQGEVVEVYSASDPSQRYALKQFIIPSLLEGQQAFTEAGLMLVLSHENIIRYHGFSIFRSSQEWLGYFLMEIADAGNLRSKWNEARATKERNEKEWERKAMEWMLQVATGISYLHSNQIVHRDLKLENGLLKLENGKEVVKLSDFGLSRFFSFQKEMTTSIGTEPYMSPEQFSGTPYGPMVDIWQFGGMIYEIFSLNFLRSATVPPLGRLDRSVENNKKAFEAIIAAVPEGVQDLLRRIFSENENDRPTADEIRDHFQALLEIDYYESDEEDIKPEIVFTPLSDHVHPGFIEDSPHPIVINGIKYPTLAHYYQSQKFTDEKSAAAVRESNAPFETSYRLGTINVRQDWETVKDSIMYKGLKEKFNQYPELKEELLKTGKDCRLVFATSDPYWGKGIDGQGKNMYGKLLEKLRRDFSHQMKKQQVDKTR